MERFIRIETRTRKTNLNSFKTKTGNKNTQTKTKTMLFFYFKHLLDDFLARSLSRLLSIVPELTNALRYTPEASKFLALVSELETEAGLENQSPLRFESVSFPSLHLLAEVRLGSAELLFRGCVGQLKLHKKN